MLYAGRKRSERLLGRTAAGVSVTYSWDAVDAYLAARYNFDQNNGGAPKRVHNGFSTPDSDPMPNTRVFDVLGLPAQRYYRWRREPLTEARADRIAVNLGLHPVLLWPSWFMDAPIDNE